MWHHIAITLKPVGEKVQAILYLDGENIAETSDFTIRPSDIAPSLCYLGRSMFAADPLFTGRLDDFRIYNYALSPDEIANVMTDLEPLSKDLNDIYEETVSTAIQAPTANDHRTQSTRYDLSGKPASEASKGIVIQGGKKMYQR